MSGLTHGRVGDAGPALLLPCFISAEISPSGDGGSATRMFHKANGVFGAAGVPIRGAHCRTAPAESNLSQGVGWAKRRSRGRSVSAEVASAVSHQRTLAAYRTRESWSRTRRVVAKAEWLRNGANPRFVVTSLPREVAGTQYLYEKLYCARGDMENSFAVQPCASRSTCPACHSGSPLAAMPHSERRQRLLVSARLVAGPCRPRRSNFSRSILPISTTRRAATVLCR